MDELLKLRPPKQTRLRQTDGRTFDISLRVLGLNLEGAVGVLEAEVVRAVLVDVVVLAHHLRRPSGGGLGGAAARA